MELTLDQWMARTGTGISAKTMWAALKNVHMYLTYSDKPYDPSDFNRCYHFVKDCGLDMQDIHIISERLPYWKPYIDNWLKLEEMLLSNIANKWSTKKEIGMFEYMQELREESDIIKYGMS